MGLTGAQLPASLGSPGKWENIIGSLGVRELSGCNSPFLPCPLPITLPIALHGDAETKKGSPHLPPAPSPGPAWGGAGGWQRCLSVLSSAKRAEGKRKVRIVQKRRALQGQRIGRCVVEWEHKYPNLDVRHRHFFEGEMEGGRVF